MRPLRLCQKLNLSRSVCQSLTVKCIRISNRGNTGPKCSFSASLCTANRMIISAFNILSLNFSATSKIVNNFLNNMENYHKNMITQLSCYHITSCKKKNWPPQHIKWPTTDKRSLIPPTYSTSISILPFPVFQLARKEWEPRWVGG